MAINRQTPAPAAASQGVSLGLDNFVEGGGLFDDFDGTILEAAFVQWDYDGQYDPQLFLCFEIRNDEEAESDGNNPEQPLKNPFLQYYSAGSLEYFVPSDDGKRAIPVGSKTGLSKSCNAFEVIASIIAAGFDKPITNDVSIFAGERFHFKRKAQKDRNIKEDKSSRKPADDEKAKRPKEILLMERYLKEGAATATAKVGPASKVAAAATGPKVNGAVTGPKPGPKAVPAAAPKQQEPAYDPSDLGPGEAAAVTYILEAIIEGGGTTPKAGLGKGVLAYAKANGLDNAVRNKVITLCGNEAFLSADGLGWTFDGATLTLAE